MIYHYHSGIERLVLSNTASFVAFPRILPSGRASHNFSKPCIFKVFGTAKKLTHWGESALPSKNDKNQYARTRTDHSSEIAEDYVEAISEIIHDKGECRLVELARRFQVSHVTANRTIARLKRDDLVESQPYGPIGLSKKGRLLAAECKKRHQIVLDFLMALGVSKSVAEIDSEGIEHHVSQQTLSAMRVFVESHGCNK